MNALTDHDTHSLSLSFSLFRKVQSSKLSRRHCQFWYTTKTFNFERDRERERKCNYRPKCTTSIRHNASYIYSLRNETLSCLTRELVEFCVQFKVGDTTLPYYGNSTSKDMKIWHSIVIVVGQLPFCLYYTLLCFISLTLLKIPFNL